MIDDQCQTFLDALTKNHLLTSSAVVGQFNEELNGLENKNHDSIISVIIPKLPKV